MFYVVPAEVFVYANEELHSMGLVARRIHMYRRGDDAISKLAWRNVTDCTVGQMSIAIGDLKLNLPTINVEAYQRRKRRLLLSVNPDEEQLAAFVRAFFNAEPPSAAYAHRLKFVAMELPRDTSRVKHASAILATGQDGWPDNDVPSERYCRKVLKQVKW